MKQAVRALNPALRRFEASCFDGATSPATHRRRVRALRAQRGRQFDEEDASDNRSRLALQGAADSRRAAPRKPPTGRPPPGAENPP